MSSTTATSMVGIPGHLTSGSVESSESRLGKLAKGAGMAATIAGATAMILSPSARSAVLKGFSKFIGNGSALLSGLRGSNNVARAEQQGAQAIGHTVRGAARSLGNRADRAALVTGMKGSSNVVRQEQQRALEVGRAARQGLQSASRSLKERLPSLPAPSAPNVAT